MRRLGSRACLLLFAVVAAATAATTQRLRVEVVAPDAAHIAWISAARLAELTHGRGVELAPSLATGAETSSSLAVMSVRDFARRVPAVSVLELPFFFPDLPSLHSAVDGRLGAELRAAARNRGWELLAVWDEGLELLSGNYPYTQARFLSGKEFVLLRDDPIAEKQFRALDVWTRRADPASLAQLQTECLVSSRSVTAQQIVREQLARVHLDLTLSRHRYDGWVVAMRTESWERLGARAQSAISGALRDMIQWQRERALQQEDDALAALRRDGMTTYPVAPETWSQYRDLQPAWVSFLPDRLSVAERQRLVAVALASAGGGPNAADPAPSARPVARSH